jgi:hypothetical protein
MGMKLLLSFCFGNAESFRHQNHLPKRWLAGSAAPRLDGLTRCIERSFCVELNILFEDLIHEARQGLARISVRSKCQAPKTKYPMLKTKSPHTKNLSPLVRPIKISFNFNPSLFGGCLH